MKIIISLLLMISATAYAVDGNLIQDTFLDKLNTADERACGKASCEKCFNISPTFDRPCSDQFDYLNFSNVRDSLSLPSFRAACTSHDACYQVIGQTKSQCDHHFFNDMSSECADAYIRGFPGWARDIVDGSIGAVRNSVAAPVRNAINRAYYQASDKPEQRFATSAQFIKLPSPKDIIDDVKDIVDDAKDTVSDGLADLEDQFREEVTNVGDQLSDAASGFDDSLRQELGNLGPSLDDGVRRSYQQISDGLADLDDQLRELLSPINVVKYAMCLETAHVMTTAVEVWPGALEGFDYLQEDAVNYVTDQVNEHGCYAGDLQIVSSRPTTATMIQIIEGSFSAQNLNVSVTQRDQLVSDWQSGNIDLNDVIKQAHQARVVVDLIPILALL
ncbi:hypothetical protein [Bacterioplanoides sp.]|uniref:hypothetical protein n=1 Tax=Bacterioplanoides sp. TaxID=2066072 RepID=UPI003B005DA3